MIPKTVHYCWFGRGEKSKLAKKCIASWRKYCPDYEIIEWNEDNFDVSMNPYTEMCYREKRYAFLSDYVRLIVLQKYGGIYFDTDVEALRCFDDLLDNEAFFGFETNQYVNTGHGFGAEKDSPVLEELIRAYDPLMDGQHGVVGCPRLNTNALLRLGLQLNGKEQHLGNVVILPADYLNPYDDPTGILKTTENTYSIHWYSKGALSKKSIIRSKLTRPLHRLFGVDCFQWLKR